ncbi:amino acid kinase family protein [Actinomadura madurae]|uniref:amino acid kinase family protein n=1 Tax=Actinomadura madurae TaxID=1993 RepID=UPI0020D227BD|nr:carbamate kinase [Actinomadura madurae]MCQ0020392.1 carbamate kinase [Actinomadura madurae]
MTWNGGTLNGERILIALGGNAMTAPDGSAAPDAQAAAIEGAMDPVADLVAAGARVALTHGNGPQVGNLLIKNQLAAGVVPPVPLDWCGAQTQATVGVMIMNALERALAARGAARPVSTVVTRTLVDASDPGFTAPAKPIGRYFPEEEARRAMARGEAWKRFGDRGWRRVVASPEPLEILDASAAAVLLDAGHVVVAAGGGGAPVVRADGTLRGVEAVVDKDLAAQLLARRLGATTLVIATDVENAMAGFGTPDARPLHRTTAAELAELAAAGHFARRQHGPEGRGGAAVRRGGRAARGDRLAAAARRRRARQGRDDHRGPARGRDR